MIWLLIYNYCFFVASYHMVTENATADHMAENENTFLSSSCPVEIENVLHNASLQKLERFEESSMHNFFGKSVIVTFAIFCRKSQFLEQPLVGHLKDIFSSISCDICSCKGTGFYNKFHSLGLSKCVQCV